MSKQITNTVLRQPTPLFEGMLKRSGIDKIKGQPPILGDAAAFLATLQGMAKAVDDASLARICPDAAEFVMYLKSMTAEGDDAPPGAADNETGVTSTTRPVRRAIIAGSRIVRMKQMCERTGLSRATLYVLMSTDATFPRKLKLTARTVGFLESEVDLWIAARAKSCLATV